MSYYKMIRALVLALLMPMSAWAQSAIIPSGSFTAGHTVVCQNATCTVASDAGSAKGSAFQGQGYLTELGITNTGAPLCINDALIGAVGGYHQLCFGANSQGDGVLTYNAYGGASALPFQYTINGVTQISVDGSGNLALGFAGKKATIVGQVAGGSVPVASGTCAVKSQVGGEQTGSFVANGACAGGTVILTFVTTAPNDWRCTAADATNPNDLVRQTNMTASTTSCTLTATMANNDLVRFSAQAF